VTQPAGVVDVFAGVVIVVGAYCVGRLVAGRRLGRRSHYGVNAGHVLMAIAMVGMLVPHWEVLPVGLWEAVFATLTVVFAAMALRTVAGAGAGSLAGAAGRHVRHYAVHAVMSAAMLYMYRLGMPGSGRSVLTAPMAGAGNPMVTSVLLVVLLASAVWQLDAIGRVRPVGVVAVVGAGGATADAVEGGTSAAQDRPWLAPRLEAGCHIAMCLVMAYMLVVVV
jgi:hypothetical protein